MGALPRRVNQETKLREEPCHRSKGEVQHMDTLKSKETLRFAAQATATLAAFVGTVAALMIPVIWSI